MEMLVYYFKIMMQQTKPSIKFVPTLTTVAGSCLTLANWRALGIDTFSFALETLLIKPGLSFLQSLPDLRSYLGWEGILVLNANSFTANVASHKLRSPFDGSVSQVERAVLLLLIQQLRANLTIYDQKVQDTKPYFEYNNTQSLPDFIQKIVSANTGPSYIRGDFALEQLSLLKFGSITYIESDKPAKDAIQGLVYSNGEILDLQRVGAQQHEPIDADCNCPVCRQGYTKAYLHHLFAQTPLLCQRFLIQHNVTFYQKQLSQN